MPEGHTIHRLARDLSRDMLGDTLTVSSPQGRFAAGARKLNGLRLLDIEAYGKHLFFRFERRRNLHVHLGLYGKFRRQKAPMPEPRGQVRLRASGASRGFDLNEPSACELLSEADCARIFDRLGQDPLRSDADPMRVRERLSRSRAEIGRLMLDQSVFAGVGNIYRAEALHIEKIHPERPANLIDDTEFESLWSTLVRLLRIGVRFNRIITANVEDVGRPYARMRRDERLRIYGKAECLSCGGLVRTWTQGARSIYACERCQPRLRRVTASSRY